MKLIIAGSRGLTSFDLDEAIEAHHINVKSVKEVVCGCAHGIDRAGYTWAREHSIPVTFFPAWANQYTWAFFQKKPEETIHYPKGGYPGYALRHGILRNEAMANYGDAILSVFDGKSTGTRNMRSLAEFAGLWLFYYDVIITPKLERI
jgi:hypothetical protein